jgi:tyrosine-protein kinase Etk/Wzc
MTARNERGQDNILESLDLGKLWKNFRRVLPLNLVLVGFAVISAYLVLRYTKDLYQSASTLQLDIKSEASVLGFRNFDENVNNLSREIEIIRSKLFFARVVEALGFQVSYYQYGNILFEERYKNSPFVVSHFMLGKSQYYDLPFDVDVHDRHQFTLRYGQGESVTSHTHTFGDTIRTGDFELVLQLTEFFSEGMDNRYFFTINSPAAQLQMISANTTVEPLDFNAKTITISFKDYNRYKARDILTAIDTLYIYYTQLEKNKANNQKIKFLNEQLSQTEEKLSDLETYFESFTINNRTTNLDANLGRTIHVLESLDSQKYLIQQRLQAVNHIFDQIVVQENMLLGPIDLGALPSDLRQDLARFDQLNDEKKLLLGSYNENTLVFQKKTQEMDFLRERVLQGIDGLRKNLYRQLDDLNERRVRLERDFVGLPAKRTEYTKTMRFYNLYEEFYLSLIKNKAEFELAQAGTVADYKILSPASLPGTPISPNRPLFMAVGLIAGLLLSFLTVGTAYLLDNKIGTVQELEQISRIPVIGSIPYYRGIGKENARLVVGQNPKSEITEAFRALRTNMEFLNGTGQKAVIAITSSISGEGKTFIAANLGGVISLLKNKVVLVDLDLRKPKLNLVFDGTVESAKGISTILIQKHNIDDCVLETGLPNLQYIPSGPIPPNPSELIMSEQFEIFLEELKNRYDVIIIDTPPMGLVTDSVMAMRKATVQLYVVRAEYSRKMFVRNLNKTYQTQKFRHLTLVLNSVKGTRSTYGYGYGKYGEDKGYFSEDGHRGKWGKVLKKFIGNRVEV